MASKASKSLEWSTILRIISFSSFWQFSYVLLGTIRSIKSPNTVLISRVYKYSTTKKKTKLIIQL